MMKLRSLILLAALGVPSAASAQLRMPYIVQRVLPGQRPPVAPILQGIDALRAEFLARSGSATVYFGANSSVLGAPAQATLAAQAQWLLANPQIVVRVEGYGDPSDTRDHALAVGAARADSVRDYLVLLGIAASQVSSVSFGKERGGIGRAMTMLVR